MPRLSKIGAAALAAFGWTSGGGVTASVLVVAGGGGGGADSTYGGGGWKGGAGGAGGYLEQSNRVLSPTVTYTITVGGGGSAGASAGASGGAGSNSVFDTSTALGGGAGAGSNGTTVANGNSGGSGGGAAGGLNGVPVGGSTGTGGSATQGNSGGATGYGNAGGTSGYATAGGGGGAGGAGSNQVSSAGGGAGRASSISGSSVTYAAGGAVAGGVAGTTSTGNGGSGGSGNGAVGYAGGSGIVIISYVGAQQFGGGVVTSSGGNTIHTFTTSGTLVPATPLSASYLVVAGGGGGGTYGGGGAGGLQAGSALTIDPSSTYLVTVGAGGIGDTTDSANGTNGTSSSFFSISSTGGGGGAYPGVVGSNGGSGGGGGGGTTPGNAGGTGTSGQGNNGGRGLTDNTTYTAGGGGGGAGAVGSNAATQVGGAGGAGTASSITGSSVTYAGGGGGRTNAGTSGAGGAGGGGQAYTSGTKGGAGTANLGAGGGAGQAAAGGGGNGGSGVVIISYPGATQLMAGGTVTISGGNVIHTFTSTGFLAPIDFVGNSLRFRSSASAYLNRTLTTPTLNTKWTWSGWIKRGSLSNTSQGIFEAPSSGSTFASIYFTSGDIINWYEASGGATVYILQTSQVFRDPAAWYHIICAYDSTQATAANRQKMYVNGVQITAFSTATYVAQNTNGRINSAVLHKIGTFDASSNYLDGYQTEVNFIDGQALTPSSFGTINSYGVWQPITYGGSYGTNGFYLPFNSQTQNYVGVFNGTNQYLSAPSNSAFAFGTGDFTVECFAYFTSVANFPTLTDSRATTSSTAGFNLGLSTAKVQLYTTSQLAIGATTLVANRWYHIAVTRSGTTLNIWVNGFKDATITNSTNWSDTTFLIGATPTPTNYMTGSISNLRVVKGTAVYTSDFTPATSALTNISGTSLLTLQNATIIDNSTNAFTITNNNTVTTGQTYPFSYAIFNDRSPQGNNWTPNNISGASGTTLDYMTDVPTLTSATAANYPVMNPLNKGASGTGPANGNLSWGAGGHATCLATMGASSGKWYAEFTLTTSSAGGFGITSNQAAQNAYPGAIAGLWWIYDNTGSFNIVSETTTTFSGASRFTTNQVWQVALDITNGKCFIGTGNSWVDSAGGSTGNPSTGANPTFTFTAGTQIFYMLEVAGCVWAANFGQRAFTNTPPTGFVALNTFNL